ncbi:hypothetical protein [Brachybacterium sacelli]
MRGAAADGDERRFPPRVPIGDDAREHAAPAYAARRDPYRNTRSSDRPS